MGSFLPKKKKKKPQKNKKEKRTKKEKRKEKQKQKSPLPPTVVLKLRISEIIRLEHASCIANAACLPELNIE